MRREDLDKPGEFEKQVRGVLLGLRKGEVATYGEVAEEAGFPVRPERWETSSRGGRGCRGGASSRPRDGWYPAMSPSMRAGFAERDSP